MKTSVVGNEHASCRVAPNAPQLERILPGARPTAKRKLGPIDAPGPLGGSGRQALAAPRFVRAADLFYVVVWMNFRRADRRVQNQMVSLNFERADRRVQHKMIALNCGRADRRVQNSMIALDFGRADRRVQNSMESLNFGRADRRVNNQTIVAFMALALSLRGRPLAAFTVFFKAFIALCAGAAAGLAGGPSAAAMSTAARSYTC